MLHKKHFTLPEARVLLSEVKIKLERIVDLKSGLDSTGFNIYKHNYFGGPGENGSGRFPKELVELVDLLEKISETGILVKDINEGLIDFPHIRENGEEVYLCYKSGEPDIMYWHQIEAGFAGREDIDNL